MATITAIRSALATNLATIADVQISAWMLANPTPPSLQIFPEDIEYDIAMGRGFDRLFFTIQAHVGTTADVGAQKKLDTMLAPSGATSVKAAVESDRSLGGTVSDCRVVSCSGYRVYVTPAGTQVLGAEWSVEVLGSGT